MTTAQMEDIRERASAEWYGPGELRSMAERALMLSVGIAPIDRERAWELAQFAADMLRASISRKPI